MPERAQFRGGRVPGAGRKPMGEKAGDTVILKFKITAALFRATESMRIVRGQPFEAGRPDGAKRGVCGACGGIFKVDEDGKISGPKSHGCQPSDPVVWVVKAVPRSTWYREAINEALASRQALPKSPLRFKDDKILTKVEIPQDLHERCRDEAGNGQVTGVLRRCLTWYVAERAREKAAAAA